MPTTINSSSITYPGKSNSELQTSATFAMLLDNGAVISWGKNDGDFGSVKEQLDGVIDAKQIYSSTLAFAALRADGSVLSWGTGGSPLSYIGTNETGRNVGFSTVASKLDGTVDAVKIASTGDAYGSAFAALRADGSVVTWGASGNGGDSSARSTKIDGSQVKVTDIASTGSAFAVLREDGKVYSWGYSLGGGDTSTVSQYLDGTVAVTKLYGNAAGFAALRSDGSVVLWGRGLYQDLSDFNSTATLLKDITAIKPGQELFYGITATGGLKYFGAKPSYWDNVSSRLDGTTDVVDVVSARYATTKSAALLADGSVVPIGYELSTEIAGKLNGDIDVTQLIANYNSFAALRQDGSVVTWGDSSYGGSSTEVAARLNDPAKKVTKLFATDGAYAALRSDGSVIVWGADNYGGDTAGVEDYLDGTQKVKDIYTTSNAFFAVDENGNSVLLWGDSNALDGWETVKTGLTGRAIVSGANPYTDDVWVSDNPNPDDVRPSVVSSNPVKDAVAYRNQNIEITFSEPIKFGSGTILLGNPYVAGYNYETFAVGTSSNISINGNKLIINPVNTLAMYSWFAITIPTGAILDTSGNAALTYTLPFSTSTTLDAPTATTGSDSLTGTSGADTLDGGAGADTLTGLAGDDTYIVDHSGDKVVEAADSGNDTIKTTLTTATLANLPNVENLSYTGTGSAKLTGNDAANYLTGNTGKDTLEGGAGNDTLDGGSGADALAGGSGNDVYIVDLTPAGALEDSIAESGADTGDTVRLRGTSANAKAATVTLAAMVEGLDASETGASKLNLTGNTAANALTGNDADNVLDGGLGNDTLTGKGGDDIYVVDSLSDVVTEEAEQGTDSIQIKIVSATQGSTYVLGENVENAALLNTIGFNLTGNDLNNRLTGNTVNNSIAGGAGDDTLDGGKGADTLDGGTGDDTYYFDAADTLIDSDGTDTILASVTFSLADAKWSATSGTIENATLLGTGALKLTGSNGTNRLAGNDGANVLDGGLGADTLAGGKGNDTYVVDNADDVIQEIAGTPGGTDLVNSSVSFILGDYLEKLTLTGTADIDGTGNKLANTLLGNDGANVLTGGEGADILKGGKGNDTYVLELVKTGSAGTTLKIADTISEKTGEGSSDTAVLTGEFADLVSASLLQLMANVEHLDASQTGATKLNLTGNTLNNTLTGNTAGNVLDGGTGNDTLTGGAGNDTLKGGTGNDVFVFNAALDEAGNLDKITDFAAGSDKIRLAAEIFTGLSSGTVASDAFSSGAGLKAASTAAQRLVYDTTSGTLYYDADGNGDELAVAFVGIAASMGKPVTSLSANDFIVVSG